MRKYARPLALVLALCLILAGCSKVGPQDEASSQITAPSDHSRDYYTQIRGSGQDTWLMLFSINAANAEEFGLASHMLSQLLTTDLSDKITIVVQIYGADEWQGEFMSKLSDRIRITHGAVQTAADDSGEPDGSAGQLKDFVTDAMAQTSADRTALILWGDQYMDAADLADALADAKLDFLAMNTRPYTAFEDLYLLRDAADYLIASGGQYAVSWDYAHLLETLSANTSYLTADITRLLTEGVLGDDLFAHTDTTPALYCADLTRMEHLYQCLSAFLAEVQGSIETGKFAGIALARSQSALDSTHVNLRAFVETLIYESSAACLQAHDDALVYAGSTDLSLSMYLPAHADADPDFTMTISHYAANGVDYTTLIPAYLTAASCTDGIGEDQRWYLTSVASQYTANAADHLYPADKVTLSFTGENFVFPLAPEDAYKVADAYTLTFADTGEHYLLLGSTPAGGKDLSGDLIAAAGTDQWMYINGQPVCCYGYLGSDGSQHYLVPCTVDGQAAQLLVTGEDVPTSLITMGVFTGTRDIVTGDILSFPYPIYSYEGVYAGDEPYGYQVAVADGLTVSTGPVDIGDMLLRGFLTDISGHTYRTDVVNLRTEMYQ